jgi:hypothetical protein
VKYCFTSPCMMDVARREDKPDQGPLDVISDG